jgi:hypothetical protein
MKTIFNSKRGHYLARVSIFLMMAALVAGMVGCGPTQYDLTISSTEGGEVTTPGEGTFTYNEGAVVNLLAEADEGYQFVNWTGNVSAIADVNAAATNITMNGHYSITANFAIAIEICGWHDLDAVRDDMGGSYILMNDLDSTIAGYEELASPTANGGKGWQPIGTYDNPFTGNFDGQGYEIQNLFINRLDEDDVGLFSALEQSGVIKNIGVTNATVIGQDRVGGLVGANWDGGTVSNSYYSGSVTGSSHHYHVGGLLGGNEGTVTNSHSTGSVTGGEWMGGLVGTNVGTVSDSYSSSSVTGNGDLIGGLGGVNVGTVNNSYSTGNVTGHLGVGGLVGANGYGDPGTVSNSYSTGSVTGESYVGGLVGGNTEESTVSNSYSTGSVAGNLSVGGLVGGNEGGVVTDSYSISNVTGLDNVGGLVGWTEEGDVNNSYSTGSVTGESYVGGLVGWNEVCDVTNSYSTGNVTGDGEYIGGLVGYNGYSNGGTVSNSFWDVETSGQSTSAGGTGKTTAQMQDITTFSGASWDIIGVADYDTRNPSYIWNIVNTETYPFLSWQPIS